MDTLVTVKTFTYAHEAAIARHQLEAEGIECFLKDEYAIQINPFYSNALGGVKVQVRSSDAERAVAILQQYDRPDETEITEVIPEGGEDAESLTDDKNRLHCPHCGSDEVAKQRRPSGWGFVLSIFTLGFPLPFFKDEYHCFNCGRDFKVR